MALSAILSACQIALGAYDAAYVAYDDLAVGVIVAAASEARPEIAGVILPPPAAEVAAAYARLNLAAAIANRECAR